MKEEGNASKPHPEEDDSQNQRVVTLEKAVEALRKTEKALQESEAMYRNLVERANDGIAIVQEGVFVYVNTRLANMIDYSVEELVNTSFIKHVHPSEVSKLTDRYRRRMAGENVPELYEATIKLADGSDKHLEVNASIIMYQGKAADFAIIHDITERKEAEAALRESEEQFRKFFENEPEYCYMISPEGTILNVNNAALTALGYTKAELVGKPLRTIYAPESLSRVNQLFKKWTEIGNLKNEELIIITKEGKRRTVLLSADVVEDEDGNILHSVSVQQDITERKEIEAALRESEEKWRSLTMNAADIIMTVERDGTIKFINRTVPGLTPELVIGTSVYDYIQPEHHEAMRRSSELVFQTGEPDEYELEGVGPYGTTAWYYTRLGPIKHNGQVVAVNLVTTDITERKRVEQSLRESEERYRTLTENIRIGIFRTSAGGKGRFIEANPALIELFGYETKEELMRKNVADLYRYPYERERFSRQMLEKGLVRNAVFEFTRKDGTVFWGEVNTVSVYDDEGEVVFYDGIIEDITEQKRTEEEMRKRMMKFSLVEGTVYLVPESSPALSLEAFSDLLRVGYRGTIISRTPEEEFKQLVEFDFGFLSLSETEGTNSLPSSLNEVQEWMDKSTPRSVVLMDRFDYLLVKNGFEDVLSFIQRLRERIYFLRSIVIISLDPRTLTEKELVLLEKETVTIELQYHKETVTPQMAKILKAIHKFYTLGIRPSYTSIGQELEISRPTVRKRIRYLHSVGYVTVTKKGKNKYIGLTEKGSLFCSQ